MAEISSGMSFPYKTVNITEYLKDPFAWSYRCEGAWTMVVSLKKFNTVVRLKKRECCDSRALRKEDSLQETLRNLNFTKNVFSPLMGDAYVHAGDLISIPPNFAEAMNEICRWERPEHRIHKVIDERCRFGVVVPDFCFLPLSSIHHRPEESLRFATLSVELKPKCGFLPVSPFIDASRKVKYSVCHYCMLQKLKVKEGKYNRESKYCPLDLFSADWRRVIYALECLVSDPQNNLRVFSDGIGIFTEELVQQAIKERAICCAERLLEKSLVGTEVFRDKLVEEDHRCCFLGAHSRKFLEILLQVLVDDSIRDEKMDHWKFANGSPQFCQRSKFLESETNQGRSANNYNFGKGGVLQRLLSVQKLDDIDVEGVYPLYKKVASYFECIKDARSELGVDGPYSCPLWQSVSSSLTNTSQTSEKRTLLTSQTSSNEIAEEDLDVMDQKCLYDSALKICKFSVAGTAKDCSVMVAFQKTSKPERTFPTVVEPTSGEMYQYDINLIDLDPKEFDRVVKYHRDSLRAVENFLN